MALNEDKISFTDIKQYVLLLKNDIYELNSLEFKTRKGWLIYSLSLVVALCVPCSILLLIIGLLSGNIPADLLLPVALIPFMFCLPLVLLLTFINNFNKPKKLRKQVLQVLNRYDWDEPIKQIGQAQFELKKDNYLFKAEAVLAKDGKGRDQRVLFVIIPFYLPVEKEEEEEYIKNIDVYLEGKSIFMLRTDMAYFGLPVDMLQALKLDKEIDQILYVMKRFSLHPSTYYVPSEMLFEVPKTLEIVAFTVFGKEIDKQWVEWANSMLKAGYVNESMADFAQQTPLPASQQELKEKMDQILREFNLNFSKEYILNNYVVYLLALELEQQRSISEVIQSLADLYQSSGQLPMLHKYHLLNEAKKALNETGKQDFWTESEHVLTTENIDSYIRSYLYKFLEDNKEETDNVDF